MNDRSLIRKLVLAVAIKLLVLFALWAAFVRDRNVTVDASGMAAAVAGAPTGGAPHAQ